MEKQEQLLLEYFPTIPAVKCKRQGMNVRGELADYTRGIRPEDIRKYKVHNKKNRFAAIKNFNFVRRPNSKELFIKFDEIHAITIRGKEVVLTTFDPREYAVDCGIPTAPLKYTKSAPYNATGKKNSRCFVSFRIINEKGLGQDVREIIESYQIAQRFKELNAAWYNVSFVEDLEQAAQLAEERIEERRERKNAETNEYQQYLTKLVAIYHELPPQKKSSVTFK